MNSFSLFDVVRLVVGILLFVYGCLICSEKLVVKRLNNFYVLVYTLGYPEIGLKVSKQIKKENLSQKELEKQLELDTIKLMKQLPAGTYKATTNSRVLDGIRHMEQKGRADILKCKFKRKKQQKKVYYRVFGKRYNNDKIPLRDIYQVVFTINK